MTGKDIDITKMVQSIAVSLSDQAFIKPICLQKQICFELSFIPSYKDGSSVGTLLGMTTLLNICSSDLHHSCCSVLRQLWCYVISCATAQYLGGSSGCLALYRNQYLVVPDLHSA